MQHGDDARFGPVLDRAGARAVKYAGAFHFARMNNLGCEAARGEAVVFLNDDTRPLSRAWLDALMEHLEREEVGVVGGKLLYPSGALQHAGIAIGIMDGAGHPGRGTFGVGRFPGLELTRNVSAVTGACLGIRKAVFTALGGFSLAFPVNYNDVDLCLRAQDAGLLVVCEPRVLLSHDESRSRAGGTRLAEREAFAERWAARLRAPDPYYSPAFDPATERYSLRSARRE